MEHCYAAVDFATVSQSEKRSLEPGSGLTPTGKKEKKQEITDILAEKYERYAGVRVEVSEVVDYVAASIKDPSVTKNQVTNALNTLFNKVTHSGEGRRYYKDLRVKPDPHSAVTVGQSLPSARSKMKTPAQIDQTVVHPPSEPRLNMPMRCNVDQYFVIQCFENSDLNKLININQQLSTEAIEYTTHLIKKEIRNYTAGPSKLKTSDPETLKSFSYLACLEEFHLKLPTLTKIITESCSDGNDTNDMLVPIADIIGECVNIYSQKMSTMGHVSGILLSAGGMKQEAIDRQHKLKNTVHHRTTLRKLDSIAEAYLNDLKEWEAEGHTTTLVFDNLNKHIRKRQSTATTSNIMQNMTHGLAIKDRLSTKDFLRIPKIEINQVQPKNLLPTTQERNKILNLYRTITRNIWAQHIPALSWMKTTIIPHMHSDQLKQKGEMVNLGVHLLDETKPEDMLTILKEYHNLVKSNRFTEELSHKILTGDWLSFTLGKNAQETQAANPTPAERLEGLILTMADFHCQINLLDLILKQLYTVYDIDV